MPNLRTIRGVELLKTGNWHPQTGDWTVTTADLQSCVEAQIAGVLRNPVIKIGHSADSSTGPALGRVDNLRLADGGHTLVADFVDVPAAIAGLIPKAYPSRSIEAWLDFEDQSGRMSPCVLTAVALLGDDLPAVSNLAEIADLYGVAASAVRRIVHAALPSADSATRARAVAVARARRTRNTRTLTV